VVKELGVTLLCKADRQGDDAALKRGLGVLTQAVAIPVAPGDGTAALDRRHSLMLIEDPSLACEYSRDGQQELDEEKLDKKK
jgi:hypothetical protein